MSPGAADLSGPEHACLELAWEALCRGSLPVGAVVVDATGTIVATGRNRVFEAAAAAPEITGTRLAHAEVNALARLGPQCRYEDHHLVVTLEPCPLCMGALVMSTVGRLTYLGADPYAGATTVLGLTPYTARLPVKITGPRGDRVGRLAAGLHVAFYLRRSPAGKVVSVHRELRPDLGEAGMRWCGRGCSSSPDGTCRGHRSPVSCWPRRDRVGYLPPPGSWPCHRGSTSAATASSTDSSPA